MILRLKQLQCVFVFVRQPEAVVYRLLDILLFVLFVHMTMCTTLLRELFYLPFDTFSHCVCLYSASASMCFISSAAPATVNLNQGDQS